MDLKTGLDDVDKRKFLPLPGLEFQPVASRFTDCAIQAPNLFSSHDNLLATMMCTLICLLITKDILIMLNCLSFGCY
jgi:hypothetical protein